MQRKTVDQAIDATEKEIGEKKVHGFDGSQFTDRGLKWWNQMNVAWNAINNPTERQRELIKDYRRSRSRSGRKEAMVALAVDILGSRDATWIETALQGEAPIPSLLGDDYLPQKTRNAARRSFQIEKR